MLACALEAEVQDYLEATRDQRDEHGRALVVRNGYAREREVLLGAGSVEVKAPRVNDRRVDADGNRRRFKSVIVPPYMRRSPKVAEVLPLLYLHGLSSGDFVPALEEFFGTEAGLSASTITRLTQQWQVEREHFMQRDLSERDYVYVWVEGIHTGVRLGGDDRLCCSLVMVGARLDGTKELVAIEDGYRESTESWACLLRDLKKRGMRAPELAVGCRRRRGFGLLECHPRRIPADPGSTRLGPQNHQHPRRDAQKRSSPSEGGHQGDYLRRKQERSHESHRGVCR